MSIIEGGKGDSPLHPFQMSTFDMYEVLKTSEASCQILFLPFY